MSAPDQCPEAKCDRVNCERVETAHRPCWCADAAGPLTLNRPPVAAAAASEKKR